ncbi:ATP-binding protein [Actinomadura alba]|uniref:ATP-binding protein n=1 Tax=Actinomadura alba TaxID=406431 RepID=A0ABR7LY24_9ACTN|nr:ATP-binding protein [Actinomadura alba]MBC6469454.1 ATP-binding protein [Actinomadura alba]
MIVVTATPVISGDPWDVRVGGFPAWPLPLDATGAGIARSLVRTVFGVLGMPAELTYDTTLVISELATNAYVHAYGGGRSAGAPAGSPEMWVYVRWGARPEVVLKIFDSGPWRGPFTDGLSRPPPTAESGRGLEVAHALTAVHGGQWGMHRTWSRLGARPVVGKAVFVTVPLPSTCLAAMTPSHGSAREVAERLQRMFEIRGMARVQRTDGHGMAVICVRAGVHVWVRDDGISYRVPGNGRAGLGLCDVVEAAERIVGHCADLDAVTGKGVAS